MTERQQVHSPNAPNPVAPYSHGMVGAGLVIPSGQVGIDPATGAMVVGGAAAEARQAIANLAAILEAAGSGLDRVLKTTVFLVDMADFQAVNEAYRAAFPEPYPSRTAVCVQALPVNARVEIECVALAPETS